MKFKKTFKTIMGNEIYFTGQKLSLRNKFKLDFQEINMVTDPQRQNFKPGGNIRTIYVH